MANIMAEGGVLAEIYDFWFERVAPDFFFAVSDLRAMVLTSNFISLRVDLYRLL